MKTITLTSISIREIRYRPNDSEPTVVIYYDLLDENGNIVGQKDHLIRQSDLPNKATTALTNYAKEMGDILNTKDL